jgi:AcrR family transcriptional regulator
VTTPTRDAERTRSELLAVATEVFAEDGYSGARVDVIAERTRTTKRMIYYYFGSKEGLYLAVLEEAYRGIREAERSIDVDHTDPVAAVRELAELTFDHHVTHEAFIRLVAIENIHRGEFIRRIDSLRTLSQPAKSLLEDILERGRAAGAFRTDVDAVDVHMVISAYCVFPVANQHTFGYLFDVSFTDPARRRHLRAMIGDVVVGWLTARTR